MTQGFVGTIRVFLQEIKIIIVVRLTSVTYKLRNKTIEASHTKKYLKHCFLEENIFLECTI